VWVMDPSVETISNSVGMPDYVLDAVRSMQGVKYAVPLYSGGALVKLGDGTWQSVTVVGLDDTSLYGRPEFPEGKIEDIYAENGFIVVKDAEFSKLENPRIGSTFELNDNRGVIVGVARWRLPAFTAFPPCIRLISERSNTFQILASRSPTSWSSPKAPAIFRGSNSRSRLLDTARGPKTSS